MGVSAIVAIVAFAAGCHPPVHHSYVSMASREAGDLDVSGFVGGGAPVYVMGGGHVEPYLTETISLPIAVNAGWGGGTESRAMEEQTDFLELYVTGRVGGRLRIAETFAIGLGVGGGYARFSNYMQPVGPAHVETTDGGDLLVDLELAVGHRWSSFGFSVALRPTWEALDLIALHFPLEAGVAWYPTTEGSWALVLSGIFDFAIPGPTAGGAGGLGVMVHL